MHSSNYYDLEGSFNLRDTTLQNGNYIFITEPGWTASGNRRLIIKQNNSAVTGWTELDGYSMGSNIYRYQLPDNYLKSQAATKDIQYIFRYTTYYSGSSYYNGFIVGAPGTHRFYIQGNNGAYTETGYYDFVPHPKPFSLTISNRYPAAGRQTVLDLQFTVDVDLATNS